MDDLGMNIRVYGISQYYIWFLCVFHFCAEISSSRKWKLLGSWLPEKQLNCWPSGTDFFHYACKVPKWATVVNLLDILHSLCKIGKAHEGLSCNVLCTALRQVWISLCTCKWWTAIQQDTCDAQFQTYFRCNPGIYFQS